jgi:flagellar FliL protein
VAIATTASKPKGGIPLIAVLIVTIVCGAAGAFFGMQVPTLVEPDASGGKPETHSKVEAEAKKIDVRTLAPITTNLARPANTWIRLETAALVKEELGPEGNALLGKLAEDVVAYLRTVPLDQLEGASGFQHLREDLNERVRIRSEGKITELIVQALVVE